MNKILVLLFSLIFIENSYSYEVKSICAKYRTNFSWSKNYRVTTYIYTGRELNRIVRSFSQFDSFDHYAVIWWDNGHASIIKMDFYAPGTMLIDHNGIDQNGRQWQLSDRNYSGICL